MVLWGADVNMKNSWGTFLVWKETIRTARLTQERQRVEKWNEIRGGCEINLIFER